MPAIPVMGRVDEQRRLSADVPASVAAGPVEVTIVVPSVEEDEAGHAWTDGIAREWAEELNDPRQEFYTLEDRSV